MVRTLRKHVSYCSLYSENFNFKFLRTIYLKAKLVLVEDSKQVDDFHSRYLRMLVYLFCFFHVHLLLHGEVHQTCLGVLQAYSRIKNKICLWRFKYLWSWPVARMLKLFLHKYSLSSFRFIFSHIENLMVFFTWCFLMICL